MAASENAYIEHTFAARWKLQDSAMLGKGGFSEVYLVKHKKTGQFAAVKIMDKKGMHKEDIDCVYEECRIMRMLQHPNIVKFIDVFDEGGKIYLVIEYLEGGALFDRVVKKDHYSEKDARDCVYVFLSSLKYCHDMDIIHRDIKPENLLMSSADDDADVKIADFGLSIHLPNGGTCTQTCGTPNYVAPEMITKKGYGKPVDMWAVGCIAFILLGGYLPFDTEDDPKNKKLYQLIRNGEFAFEYDFKTVSDEAKNLISGLLTVDPLKRLTVDQALDHPWIKRAGSDLAARNLANNLKAFKSFVARRKFKGVVKGIIAGNKFKHILQSFKKAAVAQKEIDAKDEEDFSRTGWKHILVEVGDKMVESWVHTDGRVCETNPHTGTGAFADTPTPPAPGATPAPPAPPYNEAVYSSEKW